MDRMPPSGEQHTLRHGDQEAVVTGVGASLRQYRADGRDLIVPFEADELRPVFRGATLAPWPNRVVDGRFTFDGVEHRLALTEPERGHALHGLVAWAEFDAVQATEDRVTLRAVIPPQTGYPWRVEVETTYRLGPHGLTQTVRGTNLSDTVAPWGAGPHPYLRAGDGAVDEWTLTLPADEVFLVEGDRLLPESVAPVSVDADRFDFRDPRVIGAAAIDHAFTELRRDGGDVCTVEVRAADGAGVAMMWDAACPWVQIHTADRPDGARDPLHRVGLAVEPMTCPPDAVNSGVDLVRLAPGGMHEASWTIRPVG